MQKNRIGAEYLQKLQAVYHEISKRGIRIDVHKLEDARQYIDSEINKNLLAISNTWGVHCYIGAGNDDGTDTSVNLNASSGSRTPLAKLKDLGYKIPKTPTRDEEGNYISKESLAELALQRMLSENQFGIIGGDPVLKAMLAIRELATLKQRYVNANLYSYNGDSYYLSNYNVAGTTTGRRSSRKHTFGYGNNAQNFPKHGELAAIYRSCLVPREGYIFLSVDQMSAEDWPVSALAQNQLALQELRDGVDRHKILGQKIFNLPDNHYDEKGWKESIERYLGKKTRHANNYDMQAQTFADSLAKEGKSFTTLQCKYILDSVNRIDPSIKGVFHENVRQHLYKTRTLTTSFGRERQFFGLRGGDNGGNNKIFREAYAFEPQSTVGDNTGFAVFELACDAELRGVPCGIVQEGHDSIVQEVADNPTAIWETIQRTIKAFDREITINGITFKIPVEGEIGYSMAEMETFKSSSTRTKKLEDISFSDVKRVYEKCQEKVAIGS
jgi:DNA polymerase I-like protein with 3'-5' exonuclease and polymerase domains